jgi:hypothetical protein
VVSSMMISLTSQAIPSAIDDEAFLLFLADIIEDDGELIDPLSMNNIDQPSLVQPGEENEQAQTLQNSLIQQTQEEEHE